MKRETLKIGEAVIEVSLIDSIIYMKTFYMFNDETAAEMTTYLDKMIDQLPQKAVRIWDASDLPAECFNLTSDCVQKIANWSKKIKKTRPGSQVYFIAPEPLIYGISRMYEMQAGDEAMDVKVLNSIDEVPQEIRCKIDNQKPKAYLDRP